MPLVESTLKKLGFNQFNRKEGYVSNLAEPVDLQKEIPLVDTAQIIPDKSISYEQVTFQIFNVNQWIRGGADGYDSGTGWWIGHDTNDYKFFIGNSGGNKLTWDGITLTVSGILVAGEIHIPDVDITANSLHVETDGELYMGATQTNKATAPVQISPAGLMKLGDIGSGSFLNLDGPNQRIRTSNYVSGSFGAGFTLEPDMLEVGNILARGRFQTMNFVTNNVSAVSGDMVVMKGSDVLDADMTALDASTLTIAGDVTFAVNDILRMKSGSDDEWLLVTNDASAPTYTVTRDQGTAYAADNNPAWTIGTTVVNYGQSGDGGVFITANDTDAPFVAILDHAGSPWSATTTHLRLGQLDNFLDYSASAYGIGIGTTDAFMSYDTTNGLRVKGTVEVLAGSVLNTMPSDANLAGYWSFDEGGGSVAVDSTSNANDGTITTATYAAGISGTSLNFNGASGNVLVADNAAIQNIWDGGGSISFWINPNSDGEGDQARVVLKSGWNVVVQNEAGGLIRLRLTVNFSGDDGTWRTPVEIPINTWTHVVITYDADDVANDATIYLNGQSATVSETSTPTGTRDTDVGGVLYFGNIAADTRTFDGEIDEIRFYTTELTALEAYTLYQNAGGMTNLGVKQLGGKYNTAASGARVQLFPDSNTGILAEDSGGNNVFEVIVGGTDVGDVIMGEESSGEYAKWDDSAAEFIVNGSRLFFNPYYGDGDDGTVTISGNTTLSADMFYDDLTIDNGITLTTAGYRIFVKGTLTNNGTIDFSGNDGADGAGAGGAGGAALAGNSVGGSSAGGDGAQAGVPGNPGGNLDPAEGGEGGDGGDTTTNNGGAGGTVTNSDIGLRAYPFAAILQDSSGAQIDGGTGGGGGSAGAVGNNGGGGGSGGGIMFITAKEFINSATGVISSIGGDGGDGLVGAGEDGAGGGGGGGGFIVLVYSALTNSGSITVAGGAAGSGGSVTAPEAGDAGDILQIQM